MTSERSACTLAGCVDIGVDAPVKGESISATERRLNMDFETWRPDEMTDGEGRIGSGPGRGRGAVGGRVGGRVWISEAASLP